MKSVVTKLSIVIDGRKTNFRLEDAFWTELKTIAQLQGVTLSKLVGGINARRTQSNLSSVIRVFVLEHLQNKNKRARLPHLVAPRRGALKASQLRPRRSVQVGGNSRSLAFRKQCTSGGPIALAPMLMSAFGPKRT